jgi:radical SAM superfamily enzyme YgiQ (UPF0313 family)
MTPPAATIWLCDLTYTQQTIASDVMPMAVGSIGSFVRANLDPEPSVRLFKYPEALATALEEDGPPDILGFSNYVWNRTLSTAFAATVKRRFPGVVTVLVGPNFPTAPAEQEALMRALPMIDFYVLKEGEVAFTRLAEALAGSGFDPGAVPESQPSIARITADGRFVTGPPAERIADLSDIPSPYLDGSLDAFFDGRLLPLVQTNRGCPFRCTFCVEGVPYYSRVAKTRRSDRVRDELTYIARTMARVRAEHGGRGDMFIADSNFGMYKEDLETCLVIAEMQATYGFPNYINVATGKNQKHRVLEAAKMVNGAMRLSGSVQSLDPEVLQNIERDNISAPEIIDLALSASAIGANSYSEIILALPGDTRARHFDTIRTIIEADFTNVYLFQLMLLPGTDLASAASVDKWGMKTAYRVLPRCYGRYRCLDEEIVAAEIEQICIGNNSLSFEDYIDCRHLHLIVNVFHNDGVFREVLWLLKILGLSKFEWMQRLYAYEDSAGFTALVEGFLEETRTELWDDAETLRGFVAEGTNVERYVSGELGSNLIFKYKSLALTRHATDLAVAAQATIDAMLADQNVDDGLREFAGDLIRFGHARMRDIFDDPDGVVTGVFSFDVGAFTPEFRDAEEIESLRFPGPRTYRFALTDEQRDLVREYVAIYGTSITGISRTLSKVYVRRLFRNPTDAGAAESAHDLERGQSALSGLNPFL